MGLFSTLTDSLGLTNKGAEKALEDARGDVDEFGKRRDIYEDRFDSEKNRILEIQDRLNEAGFGGLEGLIGGSTVGGMLGNVSEIAANPELNAILDRENAKRQRSATNAMAAGGLTRSGAAAHAAAEATKTPEEMAFGIENQLFGRQGGLASMIGTGGMMVPDTQGYDLAQLQAMLGLSIGGGQAAAGQGDNLMNFLGGMGGFGASGGGAGGGLGGLAGMAGLAAMFCDARLKTNIVEHGKTKEGLPICSWDWKPEVVGLPGTELCVGYLAQDIQKIHPDCVADLGEVLVVNFDRLTERLEAA